MKHYHDIPGDGGSGIAEQVGVLTQRLTDRLAAIEHMLVIGSGKGGVGKSTITANLAAALASRGLAVGVLDADFNGPSQARLFGVAAEPITRSADGVVPPQGAGGVSVLSMAAFIEDGAALRWRGGAEGAHLWRGGMEGTALREFLADAAWGALDYLVVDLPPGTDRLATVAGFAPEGAATLLVTLPSELSQTVVARSVDVARERGPRLLGLVENMAGYRCPRCGEVGELFSGDARDMAEALLTPVLARVPFDPAVVCACDRGVPIVLAEPDGEAARSFHHLADAVHAAIEEGTQ